MVDTEDYVEPPPLFDAGNLAEAAAVVLNRAQEQQVRLEAIWAIQNHRYLPGSQPLIALAQDRSEDNYYRFTAIGALGELRSDAVLHALVDLLDQPEAQAGSRLAAINSLDKLGDSRAVAPLIALLAHRDSRTRAASADALGALGDGAAVEPLIRLLLDRREPVDVRKQAALSLGRLGDRRAFNPLVQVLQDHHDYPNASAAAARGLAKLGDQAAVKPLLRVIKRRPASVPLLCWCADALGALGDRRAVPALIELLLDTNLNVKIRIEAADALEELADVRALDALIQATGTEDERLKYSAVTAICAIKYPAAVDAMFALLDDEDWEIVWVVVEGLGKSGDRRAIAPLLALLDKPGLDNLVHGYTLTALAQLNYDQAFELLSRTIADKSLTYTVRGGAAQGLAYVPGDDSLRLLLHLLDDPELWIRRDAVLALADRGDRRAVEPLLKVFQRTSEKEEWLLFEALQDTLAKLDPQGGTPAP